MSANNVVDFSAKLKAQKAKKQKQQIDLEDDFEIPIFPKPSLEQVATFLQVLAYIRQMSPDSEGSVEFDDLTTRIVLNANRLPPDEYINPQVNVGLEIEGVFPFVWAQLEDDNDPESEVPSFEEVVKLAYYIIDQLEPEDDIEE
jgi:hypothetical protein